MLLVNSYFNATNIDFVSIVLGVP